MSSEETAAADGMKSDFVDVTKDLLVDTEPVPDSTSDDTHQNQMDLLVDSNVNQEILGSEAPKSEPANNVDLLLDFGASSTTTTQPEVEIFEDSTPIATESKDMDAAIREATPPPSPPPSPEPLEEVKEEPQEPVRIEAPKPDPVIIHPKPSAPSPSSDDRPVKMPKATKISTPVLPAQRDNAWDLLLWRDPMKTGPVLAALLAVLISLTCCSVFSVVSYILLLAVIVCFALRVGRFIAAKVHTGDEVHPFKDLLDIDLSIDEAVAEEHMRSVVQHMNTSLNTVRDLVFIRDIIASLKFSVVLYAITYIGAWFNGLTLLILAVTGAFTLPKVYEVNKAQIDQYVSLAHAKFDEAYKTLEAKVPFLKKQKTQ